MSSSSSISIMSSTLFTPRFVPHRLVWKNDDDVCYECIDRNSYGSVVVRLRKFETSNVELYKANIAKAEKEAIQHECLANLCEIIIDEPNKISITVSENPRGITFLKYVETYGLGKEFNAELQQILTNMMELYKILNETGKDLCALPLQHLIIITNNGKFESMKVRRPFLAALTRRSLIAPYNRYPSCNPSFIDIASIAFYAFTQKNFFDCENLDDAFNLLQPHQRTLINEILNAESFDALAQVIAKMKPSDAEIINSSDCDVSDTSSFGVCDDEEEQIEGEEEVAANSDSDYDIVNESNVVKSAAEDDEIKTAIGKEDDDEIKTAIEEDEFETETALEEEDDEICTAVGEEDDETKTAIENDDDEIQTAIDESEELETAIESEDFELKTCIGDDEDEIKTAIEDDSDEIRTAIDESEEIQTAPEDDDEEETKTAFGYEDDEIRTAISDDDAYEVANAEPEKEEDDDFSDCAAAPFKTNDFGLHIPNLDKVFKNHPKFNLANATLEVEGNNLVYKRQFSSVTYRKLVVFCENEEITHVTYEYCYGSQVHGKCNNSVTYKKFTDMCPDANFCLMEVYIAVANALSTLPIYTFKNYGIDGLIVKFLANKKIHCEFDDQFILFNRDGQILVATDGQDKMPSIELLANIIADLSKMSENFEQTSSKKFMITFTEQ